MQKKQEKIRQLLVHHDGSAQNVKILFENKEQSLDVVRKRHDHLNGIARTVYVIGCSVRHDIASIELSDRDCIVRFRHMQEKHMAVTRVIPYHEGGIIRTRYIL